MTSIEWVFRRGAERFNSHRSTNDNNDGPAASTSNRSYLTKMFIQRPRGTSGLANEIDRYLAQDREPNKIQPLDYWQARAKEFPSLSEMVKYYLSIPASSAPAERIFSQGRRVLRWDRSSLSPQTVEVLSCLEDWYHQFGKLVSQEDFS